MIVKDPEKQKVIENPPEDKAWDLVTLESEGTNFDLEPELQVLLPENKDTTIEGLERALEETERELAELASEKSKATANLKEFLNWGSTQDPAKEIEKTHLKECPEGESYDSAAHKTGTF